ncbi:MAG: discoidin domain-containing protein, partial [Planctomycetota bacterium]
MMGRMKSFAVLVCMLSVAVASGTAFKDDFNRPNGEVQNGWSIQENGTIEVKIVDNEVLVAGEQGTDWTRSGISRTVENETRISFDFLADDSFNVHIRIDDAETSAFIDAYFWVGGPLQYASSEDGGWPGWTALGGSNMVVGEYNTLVVEQDGTDFTYTLNDEVVGTVPNGNLTSIGSVLISSDAAAGTSGSIHIDNVQIGVVVAQTAKEPSPANGTTDVPRDVVLGWAPGEYAATHDVYFGTALEDVNSASRANPMDVLISQGQTADTYDPDGLLEFATTYYWRIDEVNAAPDNAIFKGAVWSFTTEPFAYLMQNIVATSNVASDATAGPENTVNGSGLDANGGHSINAPDMWLAVPGPETLWIQYEFDRIYKLYEMLVWNYNVQFELVLGFGLKDVTVEYSTDGAEWTALGDVVLAQATAQAGYQANTTIDFAGTAARFVRLTVNSGYGPMGQFGLSEVQFMYIPAHPREPQPDDGDADVAVDTALSWRAGRDATSHEVSLSTDPDALAVVDTIATSTYDPGPLDLGTTYYWQVNEIQDAESWAGDTWSFATQEYLVVDDFEAYNDEDNLIYEAWIDGFVNDTGSTVGYFEAPFAEQTIVRSGYQSMPLFFDNTGVDTSEADFELSQDWTVSGIKSLSIAFAGAAGNTGQMYVVINNARIDYDGDPGALALGIWQAWNIDLSKAGNVSNVRSLTIGIEGAGASGVVYIDDIRLYPLEPQLVTPVAPDDANLVAHYAFDGSLDDASANGFNGTPNGAPTFGPGKDGQGVVLDGVQDYVSV